MLRTYALTKTEKGKDNLYRFYLHADKGENLAAVESCFLENYGSLSIKKLKTWHCGGSYEWPEENIGCELGRQKSNVSDEKQSQLSKARKEWRHMKLWPTDRPTDRPTDWRTDRVIGKFHFQQGQRRRKIGCYWRTDGVKGKVIYKHILYQNKK